MTQLVPDLMPVYVPREHAAEVYGFVAELLRGSTLREATATAEAPAEAGEWPTELIERAYAESSKPLKAMLKMLAERSGETVVSDELATAIGPDATWVNLAGTLGAFGRRVKSRYGRTNWFFSADWDNVREKMVYAMDEREAQVILSL